MANAINVYTVDEAARIIEQGSGHAILTTKEAVDVDTLIELFRGRGIGVLVQTVPNLRGSPDEQAFEISRAPKESDQTHLITFLKGISTQQLLTCIQRFGKGVSTIERGTFRLVFPEVPEDHVLLATCEFTAHPTHEFNCVQVGSEATDVLVDRADSLANARQVMLGVLGGGRGPTVFIVRSLDDIKAFNRQWDKSTANHADYYLVPKADLQAN